MKRLKKRGQSYCGTLNSPNRAPNFTKNKLEPDELKSFFAFKENTNWGNELKMTYEQRVSFFSKQQADGLWKKSYSFLGLGWWGLGKFWSGLVGSFRLKSRAVGKFMECTLYYVVRFQLFDVEWEGSGIVSMPLSIVGPQEAVQLVPSIVVLRMRMVMKVQTGKQL